MGKYKSRPVNYWFIELIRDGPAGCFWIGLGIIIILGIILDV